MIVVLMQAPPAAELWQLRWSISPGSTSTAAALAPHVYINPCIPDTTVPLLPLAPLIIVAADVKQAFLGVQGFDSRNQGPQSYVPQELLSVNLRTLQVRCCL